MLDSTTLAARMPSTRNAVTNGSRLHRRGVDGRTRNARRFRDLFESFAESLGGEAGLSEADRALARTAASVQAEPMQAEVAKAARSTPNSLYASATAFPVCLLAWSSANPNLKKGSVLADYLASHAASRAAGK
jgi:hypothetical protein